MRAYKGREGTNTEKLLSSSTWQNNRKWLPGGSRAPGTEMALEGAKDSGAWRPRAGISQRETPREIVFMVFLGPLSSLPRDATSRPTSRTSLKFATSHLAPRHHCQEKREVRYQGSWGIPQGQELGRISGLVGGEQSFPFTLGRRL